MQQLRTRATSPETTGGHGKLQTQNQMEKTPTNQNQASTESKRPRE